MKFIVFSDSHGVSDNMIRAVKLEKPDLCFYLGDGERDLNSSDLCVFYLFKLITKI